MALFDMSLLLEGSLAFVTGAGSGIGRETCKVLAREGATVIVTCLDEKGAKETLNSLPGLNHAVFKYNVTDFKAISEILKEVIEKYKRPPNVLVNCAGIYSFTPLLEETPETFQRIIDVNLKGSFFTSQAVCRELISAKLPGSIIHISSIATFLGLQELSAYTASKAAIEAVTRCMSKDLSQYNIRVNNVMPGITDTPMMNSNPPESIKGHLKKIPCGRMGQPREVAEMIAFLASDRASYINGAVIPVTGGYL